MKALNRLALGIYETNNQTLHGAQSRTKTEQLIGVQLIRPLSPGEGLLLIHARHICPMRFTYYHTTIEEHEAQFTLQPKNSFS